MVTWNLITLDVIYLQSFFNNIFIEYYSNSNRTILSVRVFWKSVFLDCAVFSCFYCYIAKTAFLLYNQHLKANVKWKTK